MLFSLLFVMLAHAYRFMNLAYTNDSAEIVQSSDTIWQIELGRFLTPVYWKVRGDIVAPYLIGVLSALFLAIIVYLVVQMLQLQSKVSIALLCALLTCNWAQFSTNATYIQCTDVYMLSFLLSVVGVALWNEHGIWNTICSIGFICASLALYQSYFQVAALLFMLICMKRSLENEDIKRVILDGLRAIVILIAALIMYELCMRFIEWKMEITRNSGSNGIGSIGSILKKDILKLLIDTYSYPFKFMTGKTVHLPEITAVLYGIALFVTLILMIGIMKMRHIKIVNAVIAVVLLALIPFGANAVYFIATRHVKARMLESYYLFFAFTIYLVEQIASSKEMVARWMVRLGAMALVALSLTCYNHTVYGNHMYIRRDLEFQSTLSVMTRVMDRAEQVEGYEPGYTPVAFIGTMYDSPLSMQRVGFEHLTEKETANSNNYYVTASEEFYPYYFWEILGYPFNFIGEFERSQLTLIPEIRNMPTFPAEGSVAMRDGMLIVKVGELRKIDE